MKKRKFWVSLLAGIMAGVMLLSLVFSILPMTVSAATSAEIKKEIEKLEDEQMDIWMEMDELEAQQDENWESTEEMVAQKDNIDQQINLLNTEIENINEQIRNYALLIAENQKELDQAEAVYEDLSAKNRERIRAMEEEGKLSYWSVLFKASSFMDLIDRLNMIEEIQAADERRLEQLTQAANEVAEARTTLEEEKSALEGSRLELAEAQAVLDEKRAEADEILAQLNAQQRELVAMYEEYEQLEAALSAEIAKAEKEYTEQKKKEEAAARPPASGGSSAPSSGGWVTPCSYTVLTSAYGWRTHPITGKQSFHNGVDLANVQGVPIYAAKSGTVTVATYNGVYGYYVQINHGDGFSSLYGHMTHYIVGVGQYVSAGQVIGYMGSTGWSTGPHLHFTIYYNGNTVNPMNYI